MDQIEDKIIQLIKTETIDTLEQLKHGMNENMSLPEDTFNDVTQTLQNGGTPSLHQPKSLPKNFRGYLRTKDSSWYWVRLSFMVITVITVLTIQDTNFPFIYLRNVLGAIFVLMLPGYSLIHVLYPVNLPVQTSFEKVADAERIALSLGSSMVLAAITGIILNYSPFGVRLIPIVFFLLIVTLILDTIAQRSDYKRQIELGQKS